MTGRFKFVDVVKRQSINDVCTIGAIDIDIDCYALLDNSTGTIN